MTPLPHEQNNLFDDTDPRHRGGANISPSDYYIDFHKLINLNSLGFKEKIIFKSFYTSQFEGLDSPYYGTIECNVYYVDIPYNMNMVLNSSENFPLENRAFDGYVLEHGVLESSDSSIVSITNATNMSGAILNANGVGQATISCNCTYDNEEYSFDYLVISVNNENE